MELYIPWRNLKTQPVSIVVEDLFLLAGPQTQSKYNPAEEDEKSQKFKQEKLETAELFHISIDPETSKNVHQDTFTTQLITKIVDNLQVTIKNIHLRFEDKTSNKERMFSFGAVMQSLSAVSTDEKWLETFLVNPQDAVHKLVRLDSFALYWDTWENSMRDLSYEAFIELCRARVI